MNPLTNTRNITKLNEREISLGITEKGSWHNEYKDSAWIFVGGLSYELTEGDIICVFSQCGEIVNINLVRDKITGKQKGFCFICYEDQRSTVLAVDNLNGIKLCSRIIRVDHVAKYRIPKDGDDVDDETQKLREEGCAPSVVAKETSSSMQSAKTQRAEDDQKLEKKKTKAHVKIERKDPGYEKYEIPKSSGQSDKSSLDILPDHHKHSQNKHRSEKDTSSSSKHKKSKHSLKESHKSLRHRSESDDDEVITHKHKSRAKHSKDKHK